MADVTSECTESITGPRNNIANVTLAIILPNVDVRLHRTQSAEQETGIEELVHVSPCEHQIISTVHSSRNNSHFTRLN